MQHLIMSDSKLSIEKWCISLVTTLVKVTHRQGLYRDVVVCVYTCLTSSGKGHSLNLVYCGISQPPKAKGGGHPTLGDDPAFIPYPIAHIKAGSNLAGKRVRLPNNI